MSNWFYKDSASHIGWTIPEGNRKKGKTKNIRKWQNVPDKSKTSALMNPNPIQTKTGKNRKRPDTNNQESSTFFNSNSGSIFDKAKDRMNKAKEADLNSSTLNRIRNQANSSRQRALETEKQRPVMRSIHNAQRKSSEPPVKGWDMLKPENRPATNSSWNDLNNRLRSQRDSTKSNDYNSKVKAAEKMYSKQIMDLKNDRRKLEAFIIDANIKINLANLNGATSDEIADIEGLKAALTRYNKR